MLGLNYKSKFIYVAVFLAGFGLSSFASANAELSGHFGMKFGSKLNLSDIKGDNNWADQDNRPFHFGADALYRQMMDGSSFGLGVRYRFAFTGEKDYEFVTTTNNNDKYKFTHHRAALLLNYRFDMDQFFVGLVAGVDVWKSLNLTLNFGSGDQSEYTIKSSQFLWQSIGGQLGLELGYKLTPNFLVKLEGGYDLSSFRVEDCRFRSGARETEPVACQEGTIATEGEGDDAEYKVLKLNGIYATLGIGWFFG